MAKQIKSQPKPKTHSLRAQKILFWTVSLIIILSMVLSMMTNY